MMSEIEPMNVDERRKYLHKMRIRYWQAQDRRTKSVLLDEMVAVTGLHRKALIRLIKGSLARKPRRHQRGKRYGADVQLVVETIAHSLDYPCAERLQPNLVWLSKHLVAHEELEVSEAIESKLETISVSTLKRLLPPSRRTAERIAHRTGQPRASYAQRQAIPIRRIPWEESVPGHLEIDSVHHCGSSPSGQYVHTLQAIDVATGWSECVAILGRSYLVIQDGFQRIEQRLPFPILEVHPDNGSEFLNEPLVRFWRERTTPLDLSRSRPYAKNDNRFVEENNFSLVRAYLGYERLDTVEHTLLLNQLYDQLWLYHNFFQPVMRLKEKLFAHGRCRRVYDPALPPLDRLLHSKLLPAYKQAQLLALRQSINPVQLRTHIHDLIDQIAALPSANGIAEDVRLTLSSQETALAR
jgi:hypothetical protein